MNDDLTSNWLNRVAGKLALKKRLLIWNAYHCHISENMKRELRSGYNMLTAVVPGWCTKYIQAPDVSWNKPFKQYLTEMYDEWMTADGNTQHTAGGNMKAPSLQTLIDWVKQAWEKMSQNLISHSFLACGQTVNIDGSQDDMITCFKDTANCPGSLGMLQERMKAMTGQDSTDSKSMELNMEVDEIEDDEADNQFAINMDSSDTDSSED